MTNLQSTLIEMPPITMNIVLDDGAIMPNQAHETDAGYDIFSPVDAIVPARRSVFINSGVHIEIPRGLAGLLVSKSGLNVLHDITSTGLIDADYTGPIGIKLYSSSGTDYKIAKRDKISQIVFIPFFKAKFIQTDMLKKTERGSNGYGSTGR